MAELTKDDILAIGRNHYESKIEYSVKDAKDCVLNLYGVDKSNAWCVYVYNPHSQMGLYSSYVIIVSKADEKVRYSGAANDEG